VADHVPRGPGPTAGCGRSVGGRIAVLQFRLGSANPVHVMRFDWALSLSGRFRIPYAWLDGVRRSRAHFEDSEATVAPRSSTERQLDRPRESRSALWRPALLAAHAGIHPFASQNVRIVERIPAPGCPCGIQVDLRERLKQDISAATVE
jgi:hypothetical protein